MRNRYLLKKLAIVMAAFILSASLPVCADAAEIKIAVNGTTVSFTQSDGIPFEEGGRTFVPLRAAAEAYGAQVSYNGDVPEAVLVKDGVTVRVPIGESFIYRNGEKIKNDAPARVINDRTYLPIRIVMEALGANVGWDGATSTVTVEDEDKMFIYGIENRPKMSGNLWAAWEEATGLQAAGNYSGAVSAYTELGSRFLDEGPVNAAILFQHLGECYSMLGEYHHASLCFAHSSEYWAQDPEQEQTALHFANLADTMETGLNLYFKTNDPAYNRTKYFGAPLEPESGLLLGAYAESDTGASNPHGELYFDGFPKLTGKEHGVYLLYMPYGSDISGYASHFREAAEKNCIIEIGLQPVSGLDKVKADNYLINMAKYMEESDCQFLLRFANEMNEVSTYWYTEDYDKYIQTFRTVANVFREYAPSVGIVWAPNFFPQNNIDSYYPGDEYVDYVGLSVYEEFSGEGDVLGEGKDRDHWINILDGVYERYGDRKPIIIAEGGCNYHSIIDGADVTDFSAAQMVEYYTYLPIKYPNLKMVVLYDNDEAGPTPGTYYRRFMLSKNPVLLEAYKQGINSSDRYITRWDETTDQYYYELFQNATLPAKYVELCSFITSPAGEYSGVLYFVNGQKAAEAYGIPYTVGIDLTPYAGQSVEIRVMTYGSGPALVDKTFKINVE